MWIEASALILSLVAIVVVIVLFVYERRQFDQYRKDAEAATAAELAKVSQAQTSQGNQLVNLARSSNYVNEELGTTLRNQVVKANETITDTGTLLEQQYGLLTTYGQRLDALENESHIGAPGPKGDLGQTGAPGAMGDAGPTGAHGLVGAMGAVGPMGPQGLTGPTGPEGQKGDLGAVGAPGTPGTNGVPGTIGSPGNDSAIPKGVIAMWSGVLADVPATWALCDGTNGTPDLRDKFVIGAGPVKAVGAKGGAAISILSAENLPSHTHSGSVSAVGDHTHAGSTASAGAHNHGYLTTLYSGEGWGYAGANNYHMNRFNATTGDAGSHAHSFTTAGAGGHSHSYTTNGGDQGTKSQAFSIIPPFFALAFIMKL